jgi:hypothetical protein
VSFFRAQFMTEAADASAVSGGKLLRRSAPVVNKKQDDSEAWSRRFRARDTFCLPFQRAL